MACPAAGGQREAEDALLATAHAIEPASVVLEGFTAALVEQHLAPDPVGMVGGQPLRAELAARLLVGHEHELEVAAAGAPAASRKGRPRDGLGGDLGLHVERSPPPEEAVGDIA